MKDAFNSPNVDLVICKDGSHTLKLKEGNEHYHSTNGAIEESQHVFMRHGLELFKSKGRLAILEVGFGTGMNALLTEEWARSSGSEIHYTAYEPYPLGAEVWSSLNYPDLVSGGERTVLNAFHQCAWGEDVQVCEQFTILKMQEKIQSITKVDTFDVVYFDAFGPEYQAELWTKELFQKIFLACKARAVLVTYCAKGQVRRDLQEVGFEVERLPGPPAKRHMLRARKR